MGLYQGETFDMAALKACPLFVQVDLSSASRVKWEKSLVTCWGLETESNQSTESRKVPKIPSYTQYREFGLVNVGNTSACSLSTLFSALLWDQVDWCSFNLIFYQYWFALQSSKQGNCHLFLCSFWSRFCRDSLSIFFIVSALLAQTLSIIIILDVLKFMG